MSHETERCVICKGDTEIPKVIDVKYRFFYLNGVGQLCKYCWRSTQKN